MATMVYLVSVVYTSYTGTVLKFRWLNSKKDDLPVEIPINNKIHAATDKRFNCKFIQILKISD